MLCIGEIWLSAVCRNKSFFCRKDVGAGILLAVWTLLPSPLLELAVVVASSGILSHTACT